MFAKKEKKAKKTLGSSHLICPEPEGQKYLAALKWSLPVVTKDWLLACLRDQTWVSESPFLVGDCKAFNEDKPQPSEEAEAVPTEDETVMEDATRVALEEDQDVTMENTKLSLEVSRPMEVEEAEQEQEDEEDEDEEKEEDGNNSPEEVTAAQQETPSYDPSTPAASKTLRKSLGTPG